MRALFVEAWAHPKGNRKCKSNRGSFDSGGKAPPSLRMTLLWWVPLKNKQPQMQKQKPNTGFFAALRMTKFWGGVEESDRAPHDVPP
jgi:hypothetical protein